MIAPGRDDAHTTDETPEPDPLNGVELDAEDQALLVGAYDVVPAKFGRCAVFAVLTDAPPAPGHWFPGRFWATQAGAERAIARRIAVLMEQLRAARGACPTTRDLVAEANAMRRARGDK
jgi:hypothetical protein